MEHAAAHARARQALDYEATFPDGRKETLLSVPNYDFNWQTDYIFKQPLKLPKGTSRPRDGVVRQLGGEQVESRSDEGCLVGRSDVGRDDVHRRSR